MPIHSNHSRRQPLCSLQTVENTYMDTSYRERGRPSALGAAAAASEISPHCQMRTGHAANHSAPLPSSGSNDRAIWPRAFWKRYPETVFSQERIISLRAESPPVLHLPNSAFALCPPSLRVASHSSVVTSPPFSIHASPCAFYSVPRLSSMCLPAIHSRLVLESS